MNFTFIGAALESLYYNGRPKEDKKLDARDFIELAKMANGSIMRRLYYEERQFQQEYWFFASQVSSKTFPVSVTGDAKGRKFVELKSDSNEREIEKKFGGVIRLPRGLGIFEVRPLEIDCGSIRRGQVGGEWIYCSKPYRGTMFWIQKGHKLQLHNLDKCVKNIEVDAVWNEDDLDVPYDIAFDIVNAVLGLALKVAGFPVDKNNDNNPNVRAVRNALAPAGSV